MFCFAGVTAGGCAPAFKRAADAPAIASGRGGGMELREAICVSTAGAEPTACGEGGACCTTAGLDSCTGGAVTFANGTGVETRAICISTTGAAAIACGSRGTSLELACCFSSTGGGPAGFAAGSVCDPRAIICNSTTGGAETAFGKGGKFFAATCCLSTVGGGPVGFAPGSAFELCATCRSTIGAAAIARGNGKSCAAILFLSICLSILGAGAAGFVIGGGAAARAIRVSTTGAAAIARGNGKSRTALFCPSIVGGGAIGCAS